MDTKPGTHVLPLLPVDAPPCGRKVHSPRGEQETQSFQVNLPMLKTLGRYSNVSKACVGQTPYGWALEYKLGPRPIFFLSFVF